MTSRPAAPEPETPETDALIERHRTEIPARSPLVQVYELIEHTRALERRLRREKHAYDAQVASSREYLRSIQAAIVDTVGGTVEGKPTHEGNYLQRLRELVQLESQHSLAQTEIKGHMRIEDDWKDEIERERMRLVGCSVAALGNWKEGDSLHADYDCVAIRDVAKLRVKYDEAQSRIAELEKAACCPNSMEKDAARYRWAREHLLFNKCLSLPTTSAAFDAAIDAALKDRA